LAVPSEYDHAQKHCLRVADQQPNRTKRERSGFFSIDKGSGVRRRLWELQAAKWVLDGNAVETWHNNEGPPVASLHLQLAQPSDPEPATERSPGPVPASARR